METKLSEAIGQAIEILSKKLDVDAKDMTTGVTRLMKDKNLADATALAQWKRNNRGLFRSKNYEFVVFGKTAPREVNIMNKKTGEKEATGIANVDIIAKTESGLKAYVISLWRENAENVDAFDIGVKYKGRLNLGTGGFASLVTPKDKIQLTKLKESTVPDLDDILPKIKPEDISMANEGVDKYGFYKGFVTRTNELGMELDSITSLPVMCWTSDVQGDVPEFEDGESAIVFGRPYINKKGETHLSAHAVFKPLEKETE